MAVTRHYIHALLCSTALCLGAASPALAAFNPQADVAAAGTQSSFNPQAGGEPSAALPDTRLLYAPRGAAGVAATGATPLPTAPLYPAHAIAMPSAPAPVAATTAAPAIATAPAPAQALAFPPVDPAVAAQAQAQLQAQPVAANAQPAPLPGFVAPAPLISLAPQPTAAAAAELPQPVAQPRMAAASAPVAPAPIVMAPPAVVTPLAPAAAVAELPPVVTTPAEPLTRQSKTILSQIPSKIDTAKPARSTKLQLDRVSPEVADVLGKDTKEAAYESVGLSIKVRRPGLDTNFELNRAYSALMGGDTDTAIQTYKNILGAQPTNQDALFGLAATYHRLGNLDKARPLYGELLKLNPNHREGLNNFLALISDESPQEALAELERLEQRNPDFSPIPAQQAIVLDKLGYVQESRAKMLRAIDLAPDNLTYKYNLAVMSDRNGNYADAGALYRLLIDASLHGANIPAPLADLQKRLNFITSIAATEGHALGG